MKYVFFLQFFFHTKMLIYIFFNGANVTNQAFQLSIHISIPRCLQLAVNKSKALSFSSNTSSNDWHPICIGVFFLCYCSVFGAFMLCDLIRFFTGWSFLDTYEESIRKNPVSISFFCCKGGVQKTKLLSTKSCSFPSRKNIYVSENSRLRETKHLSTDADSSTNTIVRCTKNTRNPIFF